MLDTATAWDLLHAELDPAARRRQVLGAGLPEDLASTARRSVLRCAAQLFNASVRPIRSAIV